MTTSAHKFDGLPIDNFLCDTRVRVRQEVKRMLKKLDYMLQTHKTNPQLQITIERDISVFRTFNRRLDKPSLISNTHWLKRASKRLRHMQTKYGLLLKRPRGPVKNQLINNTLQIMSERGKKARKACFIERIMLWLIYRRDWYPVFTTLTVREEHYAKVFAKDSDIWRNYVRSVRRAIELQVSGRVNRPGQHDPTAHEYTAVVERGGKHGRLHIHVLHMCRLLPAGTTDPNRRAANGTHREIQTFNKFWQYGFSSSIAVRTHTMDPYGKAGWAWPLQTKNGLKVNLAGGSNTKLARYMGKYLTKQESYEWKNTQLWRTRMTRGLGKELLTQLTSTLNKKQTEQMIHGNLKLPLPALRLSNRLPRLVACKRWLKNFATEEDILALKCQPSLSEQLKTSTSKIPIYRPPNALLTTMRSTYDGDISKIHERWNILLKEWGANITSFTSGGASHMVA